jgi:hypothetical protein
MGSISGSVLFQAGFSILIHKDQTRLEKPAKNKHSCLFGPFIACEENEEL